VLYAYKGVRAVRVIPHGPSTDKEEEVPVRRSPVLAVLGTAALAVTALTGCSAVDKAVSCASTAVTVAEAADDLQQAVSGASEDPAQAQQSIDRIEKNLKKIDDSTGDSDVSKAVDHMQTAVDDAGKAVDEGREPDVRPVGKAADELSKVCTG
jgi:outer membrane murein-binding lipoprotein Lpp